MKVSKHLSNLYTLFERGIRALYLLAPLLVLGTPLRAQGSEIQLSPIHYKLNPWGALYTNPLGDYSNLNGRFDAEAEVKASLEQGEINWTAKFVPWAWMNSPQPRGDHRNPVGFFADAKEAWIERVTPDWDLRVGNQLISWGSADKINPTDLFNPTDYTDPFRSFKLPRGSLRGVIHPRNYQDYSLEVIFSPFFRDSMLPIRIPEKGVATLDLNSSRWLTPVPRTVRLSGIAFPLGYRVTSATYPTTWTAGTRLSVMHIGDFDFTFSYMNGVESLPRFGVTIEGTTSSSTLPLTATLHPSYHRFQMFGWDGSGSFTLPGDLKFGTRFEAAYVNRDNSRAKTADSSYRNDLIKDDYVHAVAGIDYTFSKPVWGSTLYTNLQLVDYEKIERSEQGTGKYVLEGLPTGQTFDHNVVLYLENRWEGGYRLGQAFLASIDHGDGYYSPSLSHSFSDQISGSLGGDFFLGSKKGFFGQFYENSRVTLSATMEF